jgi:beta-glucosidase
MRRSLHLSLLVLLAWAGLRPPASTAQPADDARMEAFIDSLLSVMTLEEKLGQLTQYRGEWGNTGPEVPEGGEAEIRSGRVGSFLGVYGADYTRGMQRIAVEETRLGIPILFAHDVIHGFRTIFPMPLAAAASWDPEAVEESARIAAVEAAAHGLHWTFAPMVDLSRDPRWGRIVEGGGEDPYLGSLMAAAQVRGFQGDDLTAVNTLLACAKHFAAYGGAEGGRDYNVVDISERTLRETYLPPFKAAVDAGVETFMASFNEISGIPAHASRFLMNDVLRDEWGFDGFVVSDYTGVLELIPHGVAADRTEAGILALNAGVDMDMVSAIYIEDLPGAVRAGRLDEATVDTAVRRVLRGKWRVGLFEDPYRYSDARREAENTLTPEHRQAARDLAGKSIVLLKNEGNALPLAAGAGTVAVIGPLADNARVMLGGWTAAGRAEDAVTVIQGIRDAVAPGTEVLYAQGAEIEGDDRSGFDAAVQAARQADVAILVLGEHQEMSSEANNRASIGLPGVQLELAQAVHATGTPVIAVLVNGRPLAIPWLAENTRAVVEAWFLGVEMGNAVADVLFGTVNPSGKLPATFPHSVGQVPLYYNHKNTGRPPDADNKYTSKYIDLPWTPLYPFGYGLSYTRFTYGNLRLSAEQIRPDGSLTVEVDVTNAGDRAGDEVVQLYLRDDVARITRPVKELRRFERITLAPGETRTVTFTLDPEALSYLGPDLQPVVEPGTFTVFAGGNSRDVIEARFEVVE